MLELGLSVKPKYDDLLRQVRHSLEDPKRLAFCVDVEGSSAACEAYEISVFKCDGTHVLTTVVDWQIETRRFGGEGNPVDPKTLAKIYKGQQYTYGMKRTDIAEHLKVAGINEHSTILMWGGTLDIRCLRGTLGHFMELPKTTLDCSMLWRSALPGLGIRI
ncbi:hypothetical protein E8E14_007133 [Neopestalotiopsis sp. 37M]|nr:hypothetical protein E8E14_007133 [Neopestalotiopsis sp. 37M]